MYKTICNDPWRRESIIEPWCYWDNGFTEDEIKKIIELCEKEELLPGKVLNEGHKLHRVSNIKFFYPNEETKWIFERLNYILQSINNQFYNFQLNGYDSFQYTTYNDKDSGHYNWHMDIQLGNKEMFSHRKLSMTLLLNDDFEGGDFQLNMGTEDEPFTTPTKKGRAILFPSYVIHKVTPITKGTRRSIVVWCLGPKFT